MLTSFIRSIIIYFFLLFIMRLMGKKQLGELQPFELVITLVASELACLPLSDMQIPLIYGFIPILTLLALDIFLRKVVKHSIKLRGIINGRPSIVITPKGIDFDALNKLDMTMHDLLEALRAQNYLSPGDLSYAIVETNGNVSCIPKAQNSPVTIQDIDKEKEPIELPYVIISEGKRLTDNIQKANLTEDYIENLIRSHNLKRNEILLLSVTSKNYYLQPIKGNYIQGEITI